MKLDYYDIPQLTPLCENMAPEATSLYFQEDNFLYLSFLWAQPALWKVHFDLGSRKITEFEDQKLESLLDDSLLGVLHGLRRSISSSTAFSTLHDGSMPGFLKGILGKNIRKIKGESLLDYIRETGKEPSARHSVLQIKNGKISMRKELEPGILYDVAHIGDFIFALSADSLFREPYLNPEKSLSLRSDLKLSARLHKESSGSFWLRGQSNRLMRVGLTDVKAKPTVKAIPEGVFKYSSHSDVDGWLYAVVEDGKTFCRMRVNPISKEENYQVIKRFEAGRITSVLALDEVKDPRVIFSLQEGSNFSIHSFALEEPEDAELIPELPEIAKDCQIENLKNLSNLTYKAINKNKSLLAFYVEDSASRRIALTEI